MTITIIVALLILAALAYAGMPKRPMRVLLRVDIQNGFMPKDDKIPGTGELPVDGAPEIVPTVNALSNCDRFDSVVDTQDFHPVDHESFYTQHEGKKPFDEIDLHGVRQTLWNPHCRQNTPGCEFYPTLDRSRVAFTQRKGMNKQRDSYSGFWDNGHKESTGLADYLRAEARRRGFKGVEVTVVGVTRPFCDTYTAWDSVDEGFKTYLVEDACSMLGDAAAEKADRERLTGHGVVFVKANDILRGSGAGCWNPRGQWK